MKIYNKITNVLKIKQENSQICKWKNEKNKKKKKKKINREKTYNDKTNILYINFMCILFIWIDCMSEQNNNNDIHSEQYTKYQLICHYILQKKKKQWT